MNEKRDLRSLFKQFISNLGFLEKWADREELRIFESKVRRSDPSIN